MIFESMNLFLTPYLLKSLQVLGVLIAAQTVIWTIRSFIKPSCGKMLTRLSLIAPSLIWLIGAGVLLYILGMDLNSITQLLIAGGLVIGLVITPAGSNAIAGLLNLWNDVFRLHEVLEVDGIMGRVAQGGLMSVRLQTIDGTYYDVPNKLLFESVVHNFDRIKFFRIMATVHVDEPNFSLQKTKAVLLSVVEGSHWSKVDAKANQAFEAEVRLVEIASSSMVFQVIAWIDDPMMAAKEESVLLEACVLALDEAGISTGQTTNLSANGGLLVQTMNGFTPLHQSQSSLYAG